MSKEKAQAGIITHETMYMPVCRLVTSYGCILVENVKEAMDTEFLYFSERESFEFQHASWDPEISPNARVYPETGVSLWHVVPSDEDGGVFEKGFVQVGLVSTILARVGKLEQLPLGLVLHYEHTTTDIDIKSAKRHVEEIIADATPDFRERVLDTAIKIYGWIAPNVVSDLQKLKCSSVKSSRKSTGRSTGKKALKAAKKAA